jgi:Fic family protein
MTPEGGIPERLQRILEGIEHSVNETQRLNVPVAVRPDSRSIQIFLAIEKGLHRFAEIQNLLAIDRSILRHRLNTMVTLGILDEKKSSTDLSRTEYFISDDNGGAAGKPAIVPA